MKRSILKLAILLPAICLPNYSAAKAGGGGGGGLDTEIGYYLGTQKNNVPAHTDELLFRGIEANIYGNYRASAFTLRGGLQTLWITDYDNNENENKAEIRGQAVNLALDVGVVESFHWLKTLYIRTHFGVSYPVYSGLTTKYTSSDTPKNYDFPGDYVDSGGNPLGDSLTVDNKLGFGYYVSIGFDVEASKESAFGAFVAYRVMENEQDFKGMPYATTDSDASKAISKPKNSDIEAVSIGWSYRKSF